MNNEPVYITRDGTRIPYLPETVIIARDAYAATLHVLFRHLADFHLCVVGAISKKYGISEDEIMNTIHESEEFKKLTPDVAITEIYANDTIVTTDTDTPVSNDSVREKKTPKKLVLKKKLEQTDSLTELAVEPAKELKKKPRQSQSKKLVETPTPTSTPPPPAVEQDPQPEPVSSIEQKKEEPNVKKGQQKLTFKKMNSYSVGVSGSATSVPS
jgi:hypothetical protein